MKWQDDKILSLGILELVNHYEIIQTWLSGKIQREWPTCRWKQIVIKKKSLWFYTECIILQSCNLIMISTHWNKCAIFLCCSDLRSFVARQFLSRIEFTNIRYVTKEHGIYCVHIGIFAQYRSDPRKWYCGEFIHLHGSHLEREFSIRNKCWWKKEEEKRKEKNMV